MSNIQILYCSFRIWAISTRAATRLSATELVAALRKVATTDRRSHSDTFDTSTLHADGDPSYWEHP